MINMGNHSILSCSYCSKWCIRQEWH